MLLSTILGRKILIRVYKQELQTDIYEVYFLLHTFPILRIVTILLVYSGRTNATLRTAAKFYLGHGCECWTHAYVIILSNTIPVQILIAQYCS
jgi:hypothetical protein